MARSETPDLILLDIQLPLMSGYEVARALRALHSLRKTPIVAVTSYAMSGDREKTLQAGCDDYHPKPIDFSRLLTQIDTAMQRGPQPAGE